MSFVFVQGDTEPDLNATIHVLGDPSSPIDLTGALGVQFQMRKADDRVFTVDAPATVIDDEAGQVRYSWAANDLRTPGDYQCQWRVTYADARQQTTATTQIITVRRR